MNKLAFQRVSEFLAVPWPVFVAAFLYYTLLALVAVSGVDLSALAVAAAYCIPPAAYCLTLLARTGRAIASIQVDLFTAPHVLTR